MRMPSNSKAKTETPLHLVTDGYKAEPLVITIDATDPNEPMAKGKEEAGKPLYLKRV